MDIYLFFLLLPYLIATPYDRSPQTRDETIYVVSISWHTGLVVPGYCLPDSIWPEEFDFSMAPYLEIGWGDRDFYQTPDFNLWYATKGALWPTSSVLHINPIPANVEKYYENMEAVRLEITCEQLESLSVYLLDHFEYDNNGKLIPLQSGIHFDSQFFAGSSKYYFPKNSNVWTAKALKKAGFRNPPILLQTTGSVLNKADNYGKRVGLDPESN